MSWRIASGTAILVNGGVVLALGIVLSLAVLRSNPKTKVPASGKTHQLCTMRGLDYSEGAVVNTASGRVKCRFGKWVHMKSH